MKIVGMTVPYSDVSWERALSGLAQSGYSYVGFGLKHEGVQVPGPRWSDDELKQLADQMGDYGLKPVVMFAAVRIMEKGAIEAYKKRIDTAKKLGVEIITSAGINVDITPGTPLASDQIPDEHREYVRRMQIVGDYAEDHGIIIGIKPHGGNTGTAARLLHVLADVDRNAVQAFYDVGNVRYYEGLDPMIDITEIKENIPIICAKDHRGEQSNRDFPIPGEGDIDFSKIFGHLKEIGFDGYVTVERVDGSKEAEQVDQRMERARINLEQIARETGLWPDH